MGSCCAHKAEAAAVPAPSLGEKIAIYKPVLVVLGVSLLSAYALSLAGLPFMHALMGVFLTLFAVLKLFDVNGFADGFAKYDVIAGRVRAYGLAYPFIELALGMLYLSGSFMTFTNAATLAVGLVSAVGVVRVMRSGAKISCACVGTGFSLPVGPVTLVEDLGMAAMAGWMLSGLGI